MGHDPKSFLRGRSRIVDNQSNEHFLFSNDGVPRLVGRDPKGLVR